MNPNKLCSTCRYFDSAFTECRRELPVFTESGGRWPVVTPSTWCGRWRIAIKDNDLTSGRPSVCTDDQFLSVITPMFVGGPVELKHIVRTFGGTNTLYPMSRSSVVLRVNRLRESGVIQLTEAGFILTPKTPVVELDF